MMLRAGVQEEDCAGDKVIKMMQTMVMVTETLDRKPRTTTRTTTATTTTTTLTHNVGALIIRIGSWGMLSSNYDKEPPPPKKNSVGNY